MQIITVDDLENILYHAISSNIELINEKAVDTSHNKWQEANDIYYTLEKVDNPIARAILALRIVSYSYDASDILERQLSKMCSAIGERKKIHGARRYTQEKRESMLATIASEAEKSLQDMAENGFKDTHGEHRIKISYLKEYKKLAESNMALKDLKLDTSSSEGNERHNEKAIINIIEQYQRIEEQNNA